jgi:hypothetical protein
MASGCRVSTPLPPPARSPGIGQKFATGLLLAGISFAVMALLLDTLSPWIRRHTDLRQTS